MKITRVQFLFMMLPLFGGLVGCAGTQSFTTAARAGETVALAVGYRQTLNREKVSVTITDSAAQTITYPPSDPKVKAIFNLYPDPASKVVVGYKTGQDLGVSAKFDGGHIEANYGGKSGTMGSSDWSQTMLLLDLPTTMSNGQPIAIGPASVSIANLSNIVIHTAKVEILSGTSISNPFNVLMSETGIVSALGINPETLHGLERAGNYKVTFSTPTIPHSLQMEFSHDLGIGVPWVVNPPGNTKNVVWTDNGTILKVLVTPATGVPLIRRGDLIFLVTGGLSNLTQTSLKAYDINGNLIAGVTATATVQ